MGQIAVDLYSGCGGMSTGAATAIPDLEIKWALDIDKNAARTFKNAHPDALVDCCDVSLVSAADVIKRAGIEEIDWFFAGPTCQAVSTMGVFHLFVKPYSVMRFLFGMKPLNSLKKKAAPTSKVFVEKESLAEIAA